MIFILTNTNKLKINILTNAYFARSINFFGSFSFMSKITIKNIKK